MKEQKWDGSLENAKEFLDAGAVLADESEEEPVQVTALSDKSRVTELRRRIEERLDSKRIDHEYDYEDFEELEERTESLQ